MVPVVDTNQKPLMPCSEKRARKMIKSQKATPFWHLGVFCIRLNVEPSARNMQQIAVGIDPGSKKEGFTVKSAAHTLLNIQADAVQHVKDAIETRRIMRRTRRNRKTPCRQNRVNRARGGLAPSTRARWQLKLRILFQLGKIYPITDVIVEDIQAVTKPGKRKWNVSFSPLEAGKKWFYAEISKAGYTLTLWQGYETAAIRKRLGLTKTDKKLAEVFSAHCVDAWCLANEIVGGHQKPENERLLCVVPLRFHRRQLHILQPATGGTRRPYGSTRSFGMQRGSLVRHSKYGVIYLGGYLKNRVSLHSLQTGKRLCQNVKVSDLKVLKPNSFRTYNPGKRCARFLPALKDRVSAREDR